MINEVYTRRQYMQNANIPGEIDKYYGQFVNAAVLNIIKSHFSNSDIKAYPLADWDCFVDYTKMCIDRDLWRAANEWGNPRTYPWSKSDNVCILKTAHKIYHTTNKV
jgi:hypothetical protein